MYRLGWAQLAIAIMVLAAWSGGLACAQDGLVVERFHPTATSLQTIMAGEGAWALGRGGETGLQKLQFQAVPGLGLQRQFSESVIPRKGALLGTAIRRDLVDSLALELTPATRLGFSREINNVRDLNRAILSGSVKETLSLSQSFGAGETSGAFEYKQIEATKFAPGRELDRLLTEVMGLQSGLSKGYNFSAKLTTTDAPDYFGLHQRTKEFSVGLPMMGGTGKLALFSFQEREGIHSKQVRKFDVAVPLSLSGGEGRLGFSQVTKIIDGQAEETRSFDLATALAMFGGESSVVYQRIATDKRGFSSAQQTLDLQTPLDTILSGASFAHKIEQIKEKKKPAREVRTTLLETPWQAFGADTKLTLQRTTTRQEDRYTTGYDTKLITQLEGQPLRVQLQSSRAGGDGAHSKTDVLQVDMPKLALVGDSTIEYDINVTHKDGTKTSRPTMALAIPLGFVAEQAKFSHILRQVERKKKPTQEVRESVLELPADLFGVTAQFKHTRTSVREPSDYRIIHDSLFSVPLAGESLKLTRKATNIPGEDGVQRIGETIVDLPEFRLFVDNAWITGRHLISERSGRDDHRTTNVDIEVDPAHAVKVIGNYRIRDQGAKGSRDRRIFSSWHVEKNLSLNMLFHQVNDPDNLATIVRNVYVKKESSGSGLGIQAGYTTWGEQGENPEGAHDLRLCFGDPQELGITARMSEYDEKKWQRYDEPILRMTVQSGHPSRLSIKLEYEDDPKRFAPMRGIKLAFPALGGDLQVGAVQAPMGEDGKTIQLAHLYEASLKRKVLSDVDLDVGYHYWSYEKPQENGATIQYLRFQLGGGQEDRGGKVAVGFRTGDFVPAPSNKKKARPAALVDLSYARAFGDLARISLALHRPQFAQPGQKPEESIEGQLEYGDLAINYKSGVVVPREKGQKVVPASVLSLSYEDRWSDESRLVITLHRTTPPETSSELTRSIEGRMEYTASF